MQLRMRTKLLFVNKYDANDQVQKALGVRERNTKPKPCHIVEFILFQVFTLIPPIEILEVFANNKRTTGIQSYVYLSDLTCKV
nr:hypothetical protein [Tanacetum cinerariifolium]